MDGGGSSSRSSSSGESNNSSNSSTRSVESEIHIANDDNDTNESDRVVVAVSASASAATAGVSDGTGTAASSGVGTRTISSDTAISTESRWTCEACGCRTNQQSDTTCTICGTSQSGPSFMRRPGGSASFAARAGWFARGLGVGRMISEDLGMDDDVLWENVASGAGRGHSTGPDDDPVDNPLEASIALDMATGEIGGNLSSTNRRLVERHQRFIDVARAFSQATNRVGEGRMPATSIDPTRLLQLAIDNASQYQPTWARPTSNTLPDRSRAQHVTAAAPAPSSAFVGIEIGEGDQANVAHVPTGSCPGLTVRAEPSLPRVDMLSPFSRIQSAHSTKGIRAPTKMVFGFRIAFDSPQCEVGGNLGGYHLVGIVSSSFHAFTDHNALHQSPYFWGIEDSGQKYEGARYHQGRSSRVLTPVTSHSVRASSSTFSTEISPDDVPMNSAGVLFGSREIITVVVDLESRTLTFWRDDTCLGTLIHNIPRNGNLYPVAVPYNCGVTVAITSLENDPLPLLRNFATDWKKQKHERNEEMRRRLEHEKLILIHDNKPTEGLKKALMEIFRLYLSPSVKYSVEKCRIVGNDLDDVGLRLDLVMATRLWYRCGLKISTLHEILKTKEYFSFQDFLDIVTKVTEDDSLSSSEKSKNQSIDEYSHFEIGDKVELVESYEKYGDASMGPLRLGDRGIVTEVKKGGNAEKLSIRVMHNGRRWWYQPQALLSERSPHFESSASWFLRRILRAHGFDNITLTCLVGQPLTSTSWRFGDVVAPSPEKLFDSANDMKDKLVARIVPESTRTSSALPPRSRDSGTVFVEFVGQDFANAVGFKPNFDQSCSASLESRRIQCSKLVFSNSFAFEERQSKIINFDEEFRRSVVSKSDGGEFDDVPVSVKVRSDVAGLGRFERSSIDAVSEESKKRGDSLASLFAAGLPDAILSAVSIAERQVNSPEPRGDVAEKLLALGGLVVNAITSQLFSSQHHSADVNSETSDLFSTTNMDIHEEDKYPILNESAIVGGTFSSQGEDDNFSTNEASSLEHRRNAVLSFINRAGRRGHEVALLDELADGGGEPHRQVDFPARLFSSMRDVSPFVFGSPSHFLEAWSAAQSESQGSTLNRSTSKGNEEASNEREPTNADLEAESRAIDAIKLNFSYLDSVLRCRADGYSQTVRVNKQKLGGAELATFARSLVTNGILVNSIDWTKAIIDGFSKKIQLSSPHRMTAIIKEVCDEEGTPLLKLAIYFGCSVEILHLLIGHGCQVGSEEINAACLTNQPDTLKFLFQFTAVDECTIDLSSCSEDVHRVLEETKIQKAVLDRKLKDATNGFVKIFVYKLFKLCLTARRSSVIRFDKFDRCTKAVCEVLVGNVLLRALHNAQKIKTGPSAKCADLDPDKSGRFAVDEISCELSIGPQGLLGSLPIDLLCSCVLSDKTHFIQYMMVVEDILYSKDIADTASGLKFLFIILKSFPELRSCSEIERFGIRELVLYHSAIMSSRIAELLSKQVSMKLSVSSNEKDPVAEDALMSGLQYCGNSVVMCPKKHTAVLHITRHSSFRCDLCGNGVDRGRPMHGCRECDWDACEDCTDRAECGLVKSSTVKRIAADCLKLFEEKESTRIGQASYDVSKMLTELSEEDTSPFLNDLAIRLLQRDIQAAKELGVLLNQPGKVTIHQFLSTILPSLHVSLVGCQTSRMATNPTGEHQNKKPRVLGKESNSSLNSPEYRFEYCREFVRMIVMETRVTSHPILTAGIHSSMRQSHDSTATSDSKEDVSKASRELCFAVSSSEILRRLHQVLCLNENIRIVSTTGKHEVRKSKGCELQSLSKLLELRLSPTSFGSASSSSIASIVYVEPLVSLGELKSQILRTFQLSDHIYLSYCESLVIDKAIIIERPLSSTRNKQWRIAQIVNFDPVSKSHGIAHAKCWTNDIDFSSVFLTRENPGLLYNSLLFEESLSQVVLAAREYVIIERKGVGKPSSELGNSLNSNVVMVDSDPGIDSSLSQLIGTRVESNCGPSGELHMYTVVGAKRDANSPKSETKFCLISDEGDFYSDVQADNLHLAGNGPAGYSIRHRERHSALPFFTSRARNDSNRDLDESGSNMQRERALKRNWSAIALSESMRPIELTTRNDKEGKNYFDTCCDASWEYQLGKRVLKLYVSSDRIESAPRIRIDFSTNDQLPGVCLNDNETVIRMLVELQNQKDRCLEWPPDTAVHLVFSVYIDYTSRNRMDTLETDTQLNSTGIVCVSEHQSFEWKQQLASRSRKLSARSMGSSDDVSVVNLCDGIDELCMQCMEVIGLFSECSEDNSVPNEKDDSSITGMSNVNLSKKLMDQLDDPLCVVGGLVPNWCVAGPSFCPRVFTYESRRMLLERVAFGVSRSTLTQQEAKVNVGRLRQRMASLRARAVELVGEAFSGGADDPTALQLQADELYGMEEAIGTRVRGLFRAAKWQEYSLQVAKAAVRRDFLLQDAIAVMARYSGDSLVCHRRLEVRFEGESGFDAASGDEAGVTRGFYADVAELLVSTETVAGIYCTSRCATGISSSDADKPEYMEVDNESKKLPLWIPDLDDSSQVVIPTPRSNQRSSLGLFPRPIPTYHPQHAEVLQMFRFIGRLFAAAMRDGFMFPLPISPAFLKLVQGAQQLEKTNHITGDHTSNSVLHLILSSNDLPRSGFLGGEVYAADYHICRALDELENLDPPLSHAELQRRYEEIENNKDFGRTALGKSYDLSFKEYFEERTFVDPLDPTQGENAVPLCEKGYSKQVTIYNIREWVSLAKYFFLYDGVISQALAFRQGVEDLFPAKFLNIFTAVELQRDVCGTGGDVDNWDESAVRKLFKLDGGKGAAEALVAVAAIGGEGGAALSRRFGPASPTITFLVKALLEASPVQRRQFLSFVTSVPIVTPGRIEVVPMVSPNGEFLPMRDPSCLPRANTCSRRLYLPKFESYETFSDVLMSVVREESKFKGFYEWRGF